MRVKVDGLADAVQLELQNYSEEVKEGMTKAFKEIAAQCVKKLRQTSPKRGGDYAKSWKRKMTVSPSVISATVYSKKPYQNLTHLLEHGHAKAGGGRVEGIPHIGPVQEWAGEEALAALAELLDGS